jgi:hypothetical protein
VRLGEAQGGAGWGQKNQNRATAARFWRTKRRGAVFRIEGPWLGGRTPGLR